MKRMQDNSRATEFFVKAGLIAALVAAALMPATVKVHSNDASAGQGWPMPTRGSWQTLPLPPIPHLETMPWLVRERAAQDFNIDIMLAPKFEMAPASAGADDEEPLSMLQYSSKG
jgi:hypothetical protein